MRSWFLVFQFLILFTHSLLTSAVTLHHLVAFGDSLSDNGNLYEYMKHQLPLSPPYYNGRFSNGPLWIEWLTAMEYPNEHDPLLGQPHLQDYAFGGAGVTSSDDEDTLFTLSREVDSYLLAHQDKADPDSLYVIWIGSNNYLALPEDLPSAVKEVNEGIHHTIVRLIQKGAKHFLIVNLPDLGITPSAYDFDLNSFLSDASTQHNHALKVSFDALKEAYPDVQWHFLDVYSMLNEMLFSPNPFGFTNVKDTCYESMMPELSPRAILKMVANIQTPKADPHACDGYLFFDIVHPGALAHRILAENAKQILDDAGVRFE